MKKKKKASKGKIDKVLEAERRLLSEEKRIEKKEEAEEKHEEVIESLEKQEIGELKRLEKLEGEIKEQVKQHPLTKITARDIFRGTIGAFVGIILHYSIFYGVEVAEQLTVTRATIIYIISFFVGTVFLYLTGFRRVSDKSSIKFLPVRVIVLYIVSLIMSLAALILLFPSFGSNPEFAYKQVATVTLIAIIGACTADLIGKE